MSFCKNGVIDFETIDEVAPYYFMKTKMLDDGSSWGRINWLDVSSNKTVFANSAEVDLCIDETNRFSLMGKVDYFRAAGALPAGYTKLDYIASTGSQYIDTGYYWTTENTKIKADCLVTSNSASQTLWGNEEYTTSSGSTRNFCHIPYGSGGSYTLYLGSGTNGTLTTTVNKRFKMEIATTTSKNVTALVDGSVQINTTYSGSVLTRSTYYAASTTSTNVGHIFIFSNHNSSRGSSNAASQFVGAMRIYSFQMWDNDIMVRNFIPCKNASGVAGLWDTITRSFYTTPTGTFTAGNVLTDLSVPQGGDYEFMLTYPKKSGIMYNRWRQTISPNSKYVTSASGTGYVAVNTDFTNYAAPITKSSSSGSSVYSCNYTKNWWAPIGQLTLYSNGIPAADESTQLETELWVRLDYLHPETVKIITSPDFYTSGEDSNIARIVEEVELHSAKFIEY